MHINSDFNVISQATQTLVSGESVACDITLKSEFICTKTAKEWKKIKSVFIKDQLYLFFTKIKPYALNLTFAFFTGIMCEVSYPENFRR